MAEFDLQLNSSPPGAERRRCPRVQRRISVHIQGEAQEFDISGETWNLSPVGAYCRGNRAIPEVTQLMMVLALPEEEIVCKGTVVRRQSDPQHPGFHELAVFFHDMSEGDKAKLSAFVEH